MRLQYFTTALKIFLSVVHGTNCSNFTVSVLDGEDASLPCILPPKLEENNTVYWNYEEELVSEGENITISTKKDRFSLYRPYNSDWYLRISPARMTDEGIYQCSVGDVFMSTSQLIVESPPAITGYQTDKLYLQVCNTARLTLFCNVTGRPRPTIKWYKRTVSDKLKYLDLNSESIFIPEIDHSNAGVYLCKVSNTHGKADIEFYVTVIDLVTILNKVGASQAPRQTRQEHAAATTVWTGSGRNIYRFVPFLFLTRAFTYSQYH